MSIFVKESELQNPKQKVTGELVETGQGTFYKIASVEQMRPFFMSLVSDANHWMFLSSNGGLSAGRKNSEYALFPYYTDDKITAGHEHTGCKTLMRVQSEKGELLWEPFSDRYQHLYRIRRNLYKSIYGNTLIFEEINADLQLSFRYQWSSSNQFGFLREARLEDHSGSERRVQLLDGFQDVLPWGVSTDLQGGRSNLVDAYKRSELNPTTGLGIYALSAFIVDRAEPSEALKANVVWSYGLDKPDYLLSSLELDAFRQGKPIKRSYDVRAEKGAYFVEATLDLEGGGSAEWGMVANVNQGPSDIASLNHRIASNTERLRLAVREDVEQGTKRLLRLTAASDGLQQTGDALTTSRHYANVMYNIMRGGIMDDDYQLEKGDFGAYLRHANRTVYQKHSGHIESLPESFSLFQLRTLADKVDDPDFERLALEYLPLKFSRRHGDPSRPWNKFSINTQRESDGSKILDYEGNWRDIFQNWEALAHSYPEFIDGMIFKFLNASTADGYNPYRITKGGIDWEVVEPEDPWSYIGYWGDHQLIYLLKFLEFIEAYFPGRLLQYWDRECFVYANVPYRIRPYADILKDAKDTIDFDSKLDRELRGKMAETGADGALLTRRDGTPYRANLIEKILVSLLAKVSNFIPDAGIWLNTQRPEWNDANNALVGNGVSMVTLYYLKRYLAFLDRFLADNSLDTVQVHPEILDLLTQCTSVLKTNRSALGEGVSGKLRRQVTDGLGQAGSTYREAVYSNGFSDQKTDLSTKDLADFLSLMQEWAGHTIESNRRDDGLYHAYNLIRIGDSDISVSYLPPMLEGQVAVLSSGYLDPEASLRLLDALRASALYREDQQSYMLYPDRDLPPFVEKNRIPAEKAQQSELIRRLTEDGNRQIVVRDVNGAYHFNGNFHNARDLDRALKELPEAYGEWADKERESMLDLFEAVFDHRSFTGRSGTFFAYEGLGSIYWHMVSKLLLAVQETCVQAQNEEASEEVKAGLQTHYEEIKEGIGVHKSPTVYGAMPIDPYSHTPAHKGAQQPGMTGQVKEDILSRRREIGPVVHEGKLSFDPFLLPDSEFLREPAMFRYFNLRGQELELSLPAETLGFTFCQVPVVYFKGDGPKVEILWSDAEVSKVAGLQLDKGTTKEILQRSGKIAQLRVHLPSEG